MNGYTADTFEELKAKLQQFSAGAAFRWCPKAYNPFDAFSNGQRREMFDQLTAFLSHQSKSIEPYSEDACQNVSNRR